MRQLDVFRKVNGIWMIGAGAYFLSGGPENRHVDDEFAGQAAITPLVFTENPVALDRR